MRTILTVAAALLVTTAAIAQDKASQKFIIEAIQGNFAEINMGQLAEKNGREASVITYGQTLVTDHGSANQKAQQAANAIGVTSPPTGPNAKQKSMYDKMAKKTGSAFDREFAAHMIKDHQKEIAAHQKAAKQKDAAGEYAQSVLPTLQKHLKDAQSMSQQVNAKR
jgi:putative membrane protein